MIIFKGFRIFLLCQKIYSFVSSAPRDEIKYRMVLFPRLCFVLLFFCVQQVTTWGKYVLFFIRYDPSLNPNLVGGGAKNQSSFLFQFCKKTRMKGLSKETILDFRRKVILEKVENDREQFPFISEENNYSNCIQDFFQI